VKSKSFKTQAAHFSRWRDTHKTDKYAALFERIAEELAKERE
jgi:hypothetical protein